MIKYADKRFHRLEGLRRKTRGAVGIGVGGLDSNADRDILTDDTK